MLEKVEALETAQGYALCEQWEQSADAFVHSQSIHDLNTGGKGLRRWSHEVSCDYWLLQSSSYVKQKQGVLTCEKKLTFPAGVPACPSPLSLAIYNSILLYVRQLKFVGLH